MSQAAGLNRAARRQAARQLQQLQTRAPRIERPRWANALQVVKHRATRLTDDERARAMAPAHDGFKALREGVATFEQWAGVVSAVGVGLAIETIGVVSGMREHFSAADRALDAIYKRVEECEGGPAWGKRTTLYFDEIAALREAIHLHDFQLQQLAVSELHQARDLAIKHVRAAGGQVVNAPAESVPQPTQERLL